MAELPQLGESLDSLWFFANVLSSPTLPTDFMVEREEEQSIQCSEVIEHDDDSNSNPMPSSTEEENLIPSPKEAVAAAVKQSIGEERGRAGEIVFESKPESPLERRKRMARKSRSKRKILLELNLCFDDLNLFSPSSYVGSGGGRGFGQSYGILASQREDRSEMPSLNDSLVMKRHLKSCWAHPMACAVN